MDTDPLTEHDQGVTALISGLINDTQTLIAQQFALLKHEVRSDIRKTKEAGLTCGAGIGVGAIAAILLAFMFSHLLSWAVPELPLWACYGICGGTLLAFAIGLYYAGLAKFNSFNPLPDKTAEALKENVQWITNPK